MATVNFAAAPAFSVSATAALAASSVISFAAAPSFSTTATVDLSVSSSVSLAAAPSFSTVAVADLSVFSPVYLAAAPSFSMVASEFPLTGRVVRFAAAPVFTVSAEADLTGASDATALAVSDVLREILLLWGIESLGNTPDFAKRRAFNDLNSSMQLVWNQAKERDYWTRATVTATIAAAGRSVNLTDDIQNVIGPARLSNRQPLTPVTSRGEIDNFEMAFLGELSRDRTSGDPMAYFIERLYQSGTEPAKCVLHVAPAPTAETVITLDVVKEAPRFTFSNACDGTLVPMPHSYVETLLLPVARHRAMSCHLFIAESQRQTIETEFAMAMAALDMADPAPAKAPQGKRGEA